LLLTPAIVEVVEHLSIEVGGRVNRAPSRAPPLGSSDNPGPQPQHEMEQNHLGYRNSSDQATPGATLPTKK
jgi:hypothetical protein